MSQIPLDQAPSPATLVKPNSHTTPQAIEDHGERERAETDSLVANLKAIYRTYNLEWIDHCDAMDRLRLRLSRKKRPTPTPAAATVDLAGGSTGDPCLTPNLPPGSAGIPSLTAGGRTTRRSANSTTFGLGDAVTDAQFDIVLAHLGTADQKDPNIRAMKTTAVVPDMALRPEDRLVSVSEDENETLVRDPMAFYGLSRPQAGPSCPGDQAANAEWTAEEQEAFETSYAAQPKQFGWIASQVQTRSRAECVEHYYRTKRENKYRNLHLHPLAIAEGKPREIRGKRARKTPSRSALSGGTGQLKPKTKMASEMAMGLHTEGDGEGDEESVAPTPTEPSFVPEFPSDAVPRHETGRLNDLDQSHLNGDLRRMSVNDERPPGAETNQKISTTNVSVNAESSEQLPSRSTPRPLNSPIEKRPTTPSLEPTHPAPPESPAPPPMATATGASPHDPLTILSADLPAFNSPPPPPHGNNSPPPPRPSARPSPDPASSHLLPSDQGPQTSTWPAQIPQKRKMETSEASGRRAVPKAEKTEPERPSLESRNGLDIKDPPLHLPQRPVEVLSGSGNGSSHQRPSNIEAIEKNEVLKLSQHERQAEIFNHQARLYLPPTQPAPQPPTQPSSMELDERPSDVREPTRRVTPPLPLSRSSMQIRNLLNDDPVEPSTTLSSMDASVWFGAASPEPSPVAESQPQLESESEPAPVPAPARASVAAGPAVEERRPTTGASRPRSRPASMASLAHRHSELPPDLGVIPTAGYLRRSGEPLSVDERFADPPSPPLGVHGAGMYAPAVRATLPAHLQHPRTLASQGRLSPTEYVRPAHAYAPVRGHSPGARASFASQGHVVAGVQRSGRLASLGAPHRIAVEHQTFQSHHGQPWQQPHHHPHHHVFRYPAGHVWPQGAHMQQQGAEREVIGRDERAVGGEERTGGRGAGRDGVEGQVAGRNGGGFVGGQLGHGSHGSHGSRGSHG